jgi:ornithine cyclodeaminase
MAPHLTEAGLFARGAAVLHMSLRDVAPDIMADSINVVDDVAHALRENTSLAIAIGRAGLDQNSIRTIGTLIGKGWRRDPERLVIYSPFGMGALDIALGRLVMDRAVDHPRTVVIPSFSVVFPPGRQRTVGPHPAGSPQPLQA